MDLDKIDKKILTELSKNIREPITKVALKSGISQESCLYRVNRLVETGIIKQFTLNLRLGYQFYKIAIKLAHNNKQKEKEFLDFLNNTQFVTWITTCSGDWNILFSIAAKSNKEFDKTLRNVTNFLGSNLGDYAIALDLESYVFTYKLLETHEKEIVNLAKKMTNTKIDLSEKDKLILRELYINPRIKISDLRIKTKIDPGTIKYRMKLLEKDKIITGYRLILDLNKLGYLRFNLMLRVKDLSDEIIKSIITFSRQHKNVEFISRTIGSWDFELTIFVKDERELQSFIFDLSDKFADKIKETKSLILFDTLNKLYWPEEIAENESK